MDSVLVLITLGPGPDRGGTTLTCGEVRVAHGG